MVLTDQQLRLQKWQSGRPALARTYAHTPWCLAPARAPSDRRHQRQKNPHAQVNWGLLYRNVGIHPEEIRDLKRSSHMTLNLLPGYWQVQPEPEASLKDPTTPLSRATVVHQRDPAKRRKLHKRTGSRTFGNYPRNEPTIADILRRTGIATDLRRSTRRVGAMLAQASPLNRCPLVASCWRHVLCL